MRGRPAAGLRGVSEWEARAASYKRARASEAEDAQAAPASGLEALLERLPPGVITEYFGGSAVFAANKGLLACLRLKVGRTGAPWGIDPAQFLGSGPAWLAYLDYMGIPASAGRGPDDLSRAIERHLGTCWLHAWERSFYSDRSPEDVRAEVVGELCRSFHRGVAARLAGREDALRCLAMLRARLHGPAVAARWADVSERVAAAAAENDKADVLEWLRPRPTRELAKLAASFDSVAACEYLIARNPDLARTVVNALSPAGVERLEAAPGADYGRHMRVLEACESGRPETAVWFAATRRTPWDSLLWGLMGRAVLDGNLDHVRAAVRAGCPWDNDAVPGHGWEYSGSAAESAAVTGYVTLSGMRPSQWAWARLIRRGATAVLGALARENGLTPPAAAVTSCAPNTPPETFAWYDTAGVGFPEDGVARALIRASNFRSFVFLYDRGRFARCAGLLEEAACRGSTRIREALAARGLVQDPGELCRRFEELTQAEPPPERALEWMFQTVPAGDDDLPGIERCLLACRHVRKQGGDRPFKPVVVARRVAAYCGGVCPDAAQRLCEALGLEPKARGRKSCVASIRRRFEA